MHSWRLAGSLAAALLLTCGRAAVRAAPSDDTATLLRIFLTDGTSLVSYGEPARVDDRVVFSMPTASTPNPPLHLINIAADKVDWERTNRYAAAARTAHYLETQADLDYAELSNRIAQALNDLTGTGDPARRLALAQDARKTLAAWPQDHYNYRQSEVRQMLSLLDEAIADLRASAGESAFNLDLLAFVDPPAVTEPLAPPLTSQDAIEQVLLAARLADTAAERTSLLGTALAGLDRDRGVLPTEWLAATRRDTKVRYDAQLLIDRTYQSMTKRFMAMANLRAQTSDVRGLERLVDRIHARDRALGGQRPETVDALILAVQAKLDGVRKRQLARDRWELRAPVLRQYRVAMATAMKRFVSLKPSLESIKLLASSPPSALDRMERAVADIVKQVSAVRPPDELRVAHALLLSAVYLAGNAAHIRREATLAGDIARAWDASSAAAGALVLGARARTDIQDLLRRPQPR